MNLPRCPSQSLADCTDSATPTCSGGVCVAMSCGGGSFTPNGAYDSLWDSVQTITGVRKCYPGVCFRLALVVSTSVLHPICQSHIGGGLLTLIIRFLRLSSQHLELQRASPGTEILSRCGSPPRGVWESQTHTPPHPACSHMLVSSARAALT